MKLIVSETIMTGKKAVLFNDYELFNDYRNQQKPDSLDPYDDIKCTPYSSKGGCKGVHIDEKP